MTFSDVRSEVCRVVSSLLHAPVLALCPQPSTGNCRVLHGSSALQSNEELSWQLPRPTG